MYMNVHCIYSRAGNSITNVPLLSDLLGPIQHLIAQGKNSGAMPCVWKILGSALVHTVQDCPSSVLVTAVMVGLGKEEQVGIF